MRKCLLCNREEKTHRGRNSRHPFTCAECLHKLLGTPPEIIIDTYTEAIENQRTAVAFALQNFVPSKIKKRHQIPARELKHIINL